MDETTFPLEKIVQYKDTYGNVYVSLDPESRPEYKQFIENTLKTVGISDAVIMYPYIPLKLVNRLLVATISGTKYDPRITNYFHVIKAKNADKSYNLNLKKIYSLKEENEPLVVSLNANSAVMNENDGIGITPNDQRSEEPIVIKPVTNWHPNKDANGNYMSAQQMSNYANYINSVISSPYYGQSYLSSPTFQYPF